MWGIEFAVLTKRSARGCKRLYQRLTYNFLLDLPLYNDGERGVFKYTIILQSSTHLLNTLTPFLQVITQCLLSRFPLSSTPPSESSTPLLSPIAVCQAMGIPPMIRASSTPQSCGCWNLESAGDLPHANSRMRRTCRLCGLLLGILDLWFSFLASGGHDHMIEGTP